MAASAIAARTTRDRVLCQRRTVTRSCTPQHHHKSTPTVTRWWKRRGRPHTAAGRQQCNREQANWPAAVTRPLQRLASRSDHRCNTRAQTDRTRCTARRQRRAFVPWQASAVLANLFRMTSSPSHTRPCNDEFVITLVVCGGVNRSCCSIRFLSQSWRETGPRLRWRWCRATSRPPPSPAP